MCTKHLGCKDFIQIYCGKVFNMSSNTMLLLSCCPPSLLSCGCSFFWQHHTVCTTCNANLCWESQSTPFCTPIYMMFLWEQRWPNLSTLPTKRNWHTCVYNVSGRKSLCLLHLRKRKDSCDLYSAVASSRSYVFPLVCRNHACKYKTLLITKVQTRLV